MIARSTEARSAHEAAQARTPRAPRPLMRYERVRDFKPAPLIAYDFETTRIAAGTPRPLYLTAYDPALLYVDGAIDSMAHLRAILRARFLTPELLGARFVAWNANNFDAYFIAAALVMCDDLVIRPYLTKSKALRGLRILQRCDLGRSRAKGWEFVDGIAMLGLQGVSLAKFLANFAPDHAKLTGVIDFEREQFDAANPRHCEYALRDSVGLWHGMQRAQSILIERFNEGLGVTMGGACMKIFKAHIPDDVQIPQPRDAVVKLTREFAMRGGYCYCVNRYRGPVWKYDLNQAYAAAMREAALPCGFTQYLNRLPVDPGRAFLARVSAFRADNLIPFYYRTEIVGRIRSVFSGTEILDTWLTSIEIIQLQSEGWHIDVREAYAWQSSFTMREYVDKLEAGRMNCEGGPSGPIGTMLKMVGNHSYGKTVEQIEPLEFILASECPDDFMPYYADGDQPIAHTFFRFVEDQKARDYHQPQLGAFITAHVRMVVRRAALLNPAAWLYADTDCVIFSEDMGGALDIHPSRYGAWKIEESGAPYQIIGKKIYARLDGAADKRSAKGLNVKLLGAADFDAWFDGRPPEQIQVQRQNFLAVLQGLEMYRVQSRRGTSVDPAAVAKRIPPQLRKAAHAIQT
jgi:hypothetical protein